MSRQKCRVAWAHHHCALVEGHDGTLHQCGCGHTHDSHTGITWTPGGLASPFLLGLRRFLEEGRTRG